MPGSRNACLRHAEVTHADSGISRISDVFLSYDFFHARIARLSQAGGTLCRNGLTEKVALAVITASFSQPFQSGCILNPLSRHRNAQFLTKYEQGLNYLFLPRAVYQVRDERAVNLDMGDTEPQQDRQVGIAGAKIIKHHAGAGFFQGADTVIGSDTYDTLKRIAGLFGVLGVIFSFIKSRNPMVFANWLAVFFIITSVLLVPKRSVQILDVTDPAAVYQVDNVPAWPSSPG